MKKREINPRFMRVSKKSGGFNKIMFRKEYFVAKWAPRNADYAKLISSAGISPVFS